MKGKILDILGKVILMSTICTGAYVFWNGLEYQGDSLKFKINAFASEEVRERIETKFKNKFSIQYERI